MPVHLIVLTVAPLLLTGLATAAAQNPPHDQALAAARTQLNQGQWREAAAAAAAMNTAGGYTVASTALFLGAGLSPDAQKKAMFQQAQDYARKAIAADPNNAEAYFALAAAQGRLAQFLGIVQSARLASDMKRHLDQALALDPEMANAYVALGLWHANLVSKLGLTAGLMGARRNEVVLNFKKAIALEPGNPAHRVEYANALLLLGGAGNRAVAAQQLTAALALTAADHWQKRLQDDAKALLARLK